MMAPEDKYELFERKICNELSAEEEASFLKLISEDEIIAEEFKLYQELNSHLDTSFNSKKEQESLEQNLKDIGDSYFASKETKKKSKVIRIPVWAYAAAASVVLILGLYFMNQGNPTYDDFAVIPEMSMTERGDDNSLIAEAENAFNSKKYKAAAEYLYKLLEKDKANTQYQFYYAIVMVELSEYNKASELFTRLKTGNSVYKYRAIWFEALNQLKQKKYDKVSELLKSIPENSEDYANAKKLLKEL